MMKALKNKYFAVVWTILRIYLGLQWIEAGWHKVTTEGGWSAAGFMKGAAAKATGAHPAVETWYANFLNNFAIPNAGLFSFLVKWGELLVGIALILGVVTTFALCMGALMNFNFMFAGSTSSNPRLLLFAVILLAMGTATHEYGLDRWVLPVIKNWWNKLLGRDTATNEA